MAKNFNKAGLSKGIAATKSVEQKVAQVVVLQNIFNHQLVDNPNNGEDVTMTSDLEESMKQNGYTTPLEVTDFLMDDGKYMIISGHRRRAAAVKVFGEDYAFPCVVRHFQNQAQLTNYALMANSQRDSIKDPCLYGLRYKMHEDYLKSIGFKGSKREEIAKRLGLSIAQTVRYKMLNNVILNFWDMIRAEQIGVSSVQPLAALDEKDQYQLYLIMQDALQDGVALTRDFVKRIVEKYKTKPFETYEEFNQQTQIVVNTKQEDTPIDHSQTLAFSEDIVVNKESALEISNSFNSDDNMSSDYVNALENVEHADLHIENEPEIEQHHNIEFLDTEHDEVNDNLIENNNDDSFLPKSKAIQMGYDIEKLLHRLENSLQNNWSCENQIVAEKMVINMNAMIYSLYDEMVKVASAWDLKEKVNENIDTFINTVNSMRE